MSAPGLGDAGAPLEGRRRGTSWKHCYSTASEQGCDSLHRNIVTARPLSGAEPAAPELGNTLAVFQKPKESKSRDLSRVGLEDRGPL